MDQFYHLLDRWSARALRVTGWLLVLLALSTLAGWFFKQVPLIGADSGLVPMAPSTALLFFMLGLALIPGKPAREQSIYLKIRRYLLLGVLFLSLLLLLLSLGGIYSPWEHFGLAIDHQAYTFPLGHMSFLTALSFLGSSVFLLLMQHMQTSRPQRLSGFLIAFSLFLLNLSLVMAYVLGAPILYEGTLVPPALNTVLAFCLLGFILLLQATLPMLASSDVAQQHEQDRMQVILILSFFFLSITIIGLGYLNHKRYMNILRKDARVTMYAISSLRANELSQWQDERLQDANFFHNNNSYSRIIREFVEDPLDSLIRQIMVNRIEQVYLKGEYDQVAFFDAGGNSLLSLPAENTQLSEKVREMIPGVFSDNQIVLTDFYRNEFDGNIYLAVLIPVVFHSAETQMPINSAPEAMMVLRIDPRINLFAKLDQWQKVFGNSKIHLLKTRGENLIYLSGEHFGDTLALCVTTQKGYRKPEPIRASHVQEATNQEAISPDGNRLILSIQPVKNTPWILLTKVDTEMLYRPMGRHLRTTIAFILLLLSSAGLLIFVFYRQQQLRMLRHQLDTDQALKQSEARWQFALEGAGDGIWDWNIENNTVFFSDQWKQLLGFERDEVPDDLQEWRKLIHPYDLDQAWQTMKEHLQGKSDMFRIEYRMLRKDGNWAWILGRGKVVLRSAEGRALRMIGTHTDISHQKKVSEDLKAALHRAEAGDKLKTAFINNISHEVRTPLNGILGFGELIASDDTTSEQRQEYLRILRQSSGRLLNTITDYMDMSMLASGSMQLNKKHVDLKALMLDIYTRHLPACSQKNLELRLHWPSRINNPMVFSDPGLLLKAMNHLLDNALKFTKEGKIELGAEFVGGQIQLFVRDTGIGISHDAMPRIFEMFGQEELRETRTYEGSGLGLSIVKGIVNLLDGKIQADSEKDRGSIFFILLPDTDSGLRQGAASKNPFAVTPQDKPSVLVAETKTKPGAEDSGKGTEGEAPLVLVAEDDPANMLYMQVLLQDIHCRTLLVENGRLAVDACRDNPDIKLVLMDMKMPVMDGFEATRMLKMLHPELPVIAVTAYAMRGDEEKTLESGCDDYLAKPVKRNQLIEMLGRYGIRSK